MTLATIDVIVVIAYYVVQTQWSPWTKYWVVLVATLLSCVALYELVARRGAPLRFAFGMKPERAVPRNTARASRGAACNQGSDIV